MLLQSKIMVQRSSQDVWAYLGDYAKVPEWDRGVGSVHLKSDAPQGVGFEFDTLGKPSATDETGEHARMSYRISEADPAKGCTVQLISSDGNARFFKSAEWRFQVDAAPQGSWVTCIADFKLRFQYWLMAPLFLLMRRQIDRDLRSLKAALEQ